MFYVNSKSGGEGGFISYSRISATRMTLRGKQRAFSISQNFYSATKACQLINIYLGDLLSAAYQYTPLPLSIVGSWINTLLSSLGKLRRSSSVLDSIETAVRLAPLWIEFEILKELRLLGVLLPPGEFSNKVTYLTSYWYLGI